MWHGGASGTVIVDFRQTQVKSLHDGSREGRFILFYAGVVLDWHSQVIKKLYGHAVVGSWSICQLQ